MLTVGRHAASGSDGTDGGETPLAGGRRRTDAPDGLWRGAPVAQLSDSPAPPRPTDRGADATTGPAGDAARRPSARGLGSPELRHPGPAARPSMSADGSRPIARPHPPLPPLASRGAAPSRPAFSLERLAERPPAIGLGRAPAAPASLDAPPASVGAPMRRDDDRSAPWSTGSSGLRAPAPRVPSDAVGSGPSPAYGDWTRPSHSGSALEETRIDESDVLPALPPGAAFAPATTAIPERSTGRNDHGAGSADDLAAAEGDAIAAVRGPATGPGRAAFRAERQAADAVRRKEQKRSGIPTIPPLEDEESIGRRPRRVLPALAAMIVIALGVLGVYTIVSPGTQEAGSPAAAGAGTATATATSAAVASPAALPTLETQAPAPAEPAAPVRVPVTVLNATDVTGLAAKISTAVAGGGWQSAGVGAYAGPDVAATTVFFTEGDEQQRLSAVQLVDAFPQLRGPAPRFFDVPADVAAPGLVVVAAGDWQP